MIDDFRPMRDKKRIEPLEREPQPSIHDLYRDHKKAEMMADDDGGSDILPPVAGEESFQTPEEVAAQDSTANPINEPVATTGTGRPKNSFLVWRWRLSRRWTIALVLIVLTLITLAGLAAYKYYFVPNPSGSFASKKGEYVPTTVASNLSGLQVEPEVNKRPVTGIMIENSLDARPQSGLDSASIVFEAIAEAGITRFMALYQDNEPSYVGPVRSVRPYYAQWCMSFDCAIAHVGGSPEALNNIKTWGTKDLDQFYNSSAYWRVSSRYAPHNMYTSLAKLRSVESSKGFKAAEFTPFTRKKEAASETPTAKTINFTISSANYNSVFSYDAKSNSYKRSQGGAAHTVVDAKGAQKQLTPKVVIAMIVPYGLKSDGYHSDYNAIGSGTAFVFQNGNVQKVTWKKASTEAALTFTGADNKSVALNAGQTWITALSDTGRLSYR